ncbi:MAG: hypothetical protein AAGJ87_15785, partial [Pseudomonadota bacterium]
LLQARIGGPDHGGCMLSEVETLFGDVVISPPSDRRMTRRLLNAWARAARGQYPSWRDMRSIDLGEDWNWTFVVDLKKSVGFPFFIYLGRNLAKLTDVYLTGEDDWTTSLLDIATANVDAAVRAEGPHTQDDELTLCDGRKVLFRAVTAPLAEDGETISHVFGAANGRFV